VPFTGYEPKGRTFESCRAHQRNQALKAATMAALSV